MTGAILADSEPEVQSTAAQGIMRLDPPWRVLSERFLEGQLIPFLGAAASSYSSSQTGGAPPSGAALAAKLAERAQLPLDCGILGTCHRPIFDLPRVASYYQLCVEPRGDLDGFLLSEIANPAFTPNPLHYLLARIARRQPMLIITTNYDNLLEKAFDFPEDGGSSVPYELVVTPVDNLASNEFPDDKDPQPGPEYAGHILHWVSGQNEADFTRVRGYDLIFDLTQRSVIYKIHGSVPRGNSSGGYVIAEEDYARFLGQMDRKGIVPEPIMTLIGKKTKTGLKSLFFLGYSMHDWNLRVLLEELHVGRRPAGQELHYAFMRSPDTIEKELLEKRSVRVYDCDLARMVSKLSPLIL